MRNARTLAFWAVALLLLLLAGAVATSSSRPRGEQGLPQLSADSSEPDGALALYLWTQRLGRDTERLQYRPFELDRDDALLVSLQPLDEYDPKQLAELRPWLEGGGSLLLAADRSADAPELLKSLGARVGTDAATTAVPAQPLLLQPPVQRVTASSGATVALDSGAPLLAAEGPENRTVLWRDEIGRGRAWVFSMPAALSNGSLPRDGNAEVYLNVLAHARPGRVLFDEYHHGRPDAVSLRALLFRERWGWALLYTGLVALLYTALRGKRLGRPAPVPATRARNSGEYVRSLASLLRSARKREYLSRHYVDSLNRALRAAAGLPPGARPQELARAAEENTGVGTGRILETIEILQHTGLDEKRMLPIVRQAEQARKRLLRRRQEWK